tara:strand:+ start:446 stop:1018 length:573 start_codon:yes stop_codon:yes gene_type:complete
MIRIAVLGKIGSGKTYIANNFGYPVFNADYEVSKLYKYDKKTFIQLNKKLPKYIFKFPIDKKKIVKAILVNKNNLKKINEIVHKKIRIKMKLFLKKNINKKIVILDIPLLLENKINNKKDVLIFVDSKEQEIHKRLKKRKDFNSKLVNIFRNIQLSPIYKKKNSKFIIKNNFNKKSVKKDISVILKKILK